MQIATLPKFSIPEQSATWARAALDGNQVDPFCCSPAWQLAFHDVFLPERRVLIAEDHGCVIAFAEQVSSPGQGAEHVFLTPLEPSWFFGCPLLGEGAVPLFAEALDYLAGAYAPSFPVIVISGISPGGALARSLLRRFDGRFRFYLHSEGIQCAASLSGGVDGYLSRRSANHRGKLKKAAKKAGEKGIYFERVAPESAQEVKEAYSRILAIENTSWKGIGQCGMSEPGVREFYAAMLERLAPAKGARIIFARHEDQDIGFIFGGLAGSIYRGQQFSYADTWRPFSIGNLMQIEKISWLCEEGARRYDMGPLSGPRMEYKAHWTEKIFPIQTWIMGKA